MQTFCNLSILIEKQAARYGDREAIIYKDFGGEEWKSLSWNTFSENVLKVSNALLNIGVKVQENIAVFSQNAKEGLFVDFGGFGVRAVTIPFYATCSEQQIQYMINDADIRIIFVGEQDQYDRARRVAPLCPTLEKIIIFSPEVKKAEGDTNAIYFDEFLRLGEGEPRKAEVDRLKSEVRDEDIANILYTSGTTGDSKGVILLHSQYNAAIEANGKCLPVTEKDRIMNFLPFSHIFERAWTDFCISRGATLIVNTNPKEAQKSMRETHPTCMCAVPRFWEKVYVAVKAKMDNASPIARTLFNKAEATGRKHNIEYLSRGKRPPLGLHLKYKFFEKTIFPKVKEQLGLLNTNIFPCAGATVSPEIESFVHSIGLHMIVGYGLTESLATVSCDHKDKTYTVGSVGRPIEGIEIKIGANNEVLLKGPTITPGYYKREAITAEAIDADGFFHTGDSGYIKDGELYLTERIKDLFKTSNGKYIAPQMIEAKLLVDKYIDQITLIADERKFVSALLVPDYKLLEEYARTHNINVGTRAELCSNPRIVSMIMDRIDTLQQQLANYEKIKRITIMPEPFTMENGELTNTLKIKRGFICKKFATVIEKMYEE